MDHLERAFGHALGALASQGRELERTIEEAARRALKPFRVPRREEIQDFQRRLDRIAARIERLKG